MNNHRHFIIHKPFGYLTQFVYNENRRKNRKLLGELHEFPEGTMAIGRLDKNSEGLLFLTTDGKVSEQVRSKKVEKEYYIQVDGEITDEAIDQLKGGVEISVAKEMYKTLPCKAFRLDPAPAFAPRTKRIRDERHGPTSWVSITITEGKYRQVRKMSAAVGFPTLRLMRVRIGNVSLNDMPAGEVMEVDSFDVDSEMKNNCFIPFTSVITASLIPEQLNDPFDSSTPEICKIAAKELQDYLQNKQHSWQHNFGFNKNHSGPAKGKMFGILVVENTDKAIGYLCTFSGKIEDEPHPPIFVPSLFDISTNDYFITKGMTELTQIGHQIEQLKKEKSLTVSLEIEQLKKERKIKSVRLQEELFSHYQFLNKAGKIKSLSAIFEEYASKKPAAGAGECAAPKLLQYAYERKMKPLAIAEFWWGESTRSLDRKHKEFYPACNDKCRPILGYMLSE